MSEVLLLGDYLKSLSKQAAVKTDAVMMSGTDGTLILADIMSLQQFILAPGGNDIDQPTASGIYSLRGSTGTKPAEYGVVISIGTYPSDIYQIAITPTGLFHRRYINGNMGAWVRTASI